MITTSDRVLLALTTTGVPADRAVAIVDRLGAIAKRRRRAKLKPIDRNRKAIVDAGDAMAKTIAGFLAKAAKDLSAQVSAAIEKVAKVDDAEAAAAAAKKRARAIAKDLDFSSWDRLPSEIADVMIGVTQDGVMAGFGQIGFDADHDIVDQVNEHAKDWATSRAAELVGMKYDADGNLIENPDAQWAITDSTREMLRADIQRAIEEGTSTDDLADQFQEAYAFSADRADTIARTELARADVAGNMIAYRDSGMVVGKEVVLGSDHDDEDECDEAADMGVVPLDDDFGGYGDPPFHPKCVCDVLPVLADEDDE